MNRGTDTKDNVPMEISRIENFSSSVEISGLGRNPDRLCLYYKEEVCAAPRVRFAACRACCRVNPHQAASNLFERIKQLASDLLNLKEPGQPPLE